MDGTVTDDCGKLIGAIYRDVSLEGVDSGSATMLKQGATLPEDADHSTMLIS